MTKDPRYPRKWDLDSLYPHPQTDTFAAILSRYSDDLHALAGRSETLPAVSASRDAMTAWSAFLKEYDSLSGRRRDLDSFIGCHAAAEAENKAFQQLEARFAALEPKREQIQTNIEFAMKAASESNLSALLKQDEWLGKMEFFLRESRRNARFRLPKEQEAVANDLAVDGIHGWGRLYDRISGALRIRVMERGEIVEKSPGQVLFDSPQRAVRENNFFAATRAWTSIADTCADGLNHISGTRLSIYHRLGVADHLEAPLRYNRMQRKTLDAMWSAVANRKPVLLKYFDAKARLLGLKKLCWYDTQAPLPQTAAIAGAATISYDEACETIVKTFNVFSSELGDYARRALTGAWVESENRAGKRQGGFCTGFPTKKQSRIFMTYTDTPDGMSTLAHELGHGYHSYVLREQPVLLRIYPMNLAETASTFAEAVLGEERLRAAKSQQEELAVLEVMLADSVVYLMNIHARFLFEDRFHRERHDGELPPDRFSELMREAQQEAYCGGLDDEGWNPHFWISKLHFYISGLPFYNFPYTFGSMLSLGIYALSGELGDKFPARYRDFLIATGCQDTEEAVRSTFGYDLTNDSFWNKSLDVVEKRVERFVELAAELIPAAGE
ncbi:MAG: M3 family oligoendopeptidase [Planctomycetaceae bacterium]